jgi:hypothetical protein
MAIPKSAGGVNSEGVRNPKSGGKDKRVLDAKQGVQEEDVPNPKPTTGKGSKNPGGGGRATAPGAA